MKIVSNFKEWAYEKARMYDNFKKHFDNIRCYFYERNTILVDLKNGKTWIAVCHERDDFDRNIGIGVAFARFLGDEIPVEHKKVKISSLHYGDRFTSCDNRYTYTFIAQEPVSKRYIYVNEQTEQIIAILLDMSVYIV